MQFKTRFLTVLAAAILSACGGGGGGGGNESPGNSRSPGKALVQPANYDGDRSIGSAQLAKNAYVIHESELGQAVHDGAGKKLTLPSDAAYIYSVGDILIIDGFGGLLLKVTAVDVSNGTVTYTYQHASITEAFEELDLSLEQSTFNSQFEIADDADADAENQASWKAPNTAVMGRMARAGTVVTPQPRTTLHIPFRKYGYGESAVDLNGYVDFTLAEKWDLKMIPKPEGTGKTLEINFAVQPRLTSEYAITYNQKVKTKETKDIYSKSINLGSVRFFAGFIPVWLTPELTLAVNYSAEGDMKYQLDGYVEGAGNYAYRFNSDAAQKFTSTTGQESFVADYRHDSASLSYNTSFGVPQVDFKFLLYKSVGPQLQMKLDATAKARAQKKVLRYPDVIIDVSEREEDISLKFSGGIGVSKTIGDSLEFPLEVLNTALSVHNTGEFEIPYLKEIWSQSLVNKISTSDSESLLFHGTEDHIDLYINEVYATSLYKKPHVITGLKPGVTNVRFHFRQCSNPDCLPGYSAEFQMSTTGRNTTLNLLDVDQTTGIVGRIPNVGRSVGYAVKTEDPDKLPPKSMIQF